MYSTHSWDKTKVFKMTHFRKKSSLQLLGKIGCNSGEVFVPKTVQISWSKRLYSACTGGRFIKEASKMERRSFLLFFFTAAVAGLGEEVATSGRLDKRWSNIWLYHMKGIIHIWQCWTRDDVGRIKNMIQPWRRKRLQTDIGPPLSRLMIAFTQWWSEQIISS